MAGKIAVRVLERLQAGALAVTFPDGQRAVFGHGPDAADITLRNWNGVHAALRSGDIGFAHAYIDHGWNTSDLPALMHLLLANRQALEQFVYGSWFGRLAHRVRHLLNRNSRAGSRRNIHAHYDIGNAFYRLWLDPGMTYSSAMFTHAGFTDEGRDDETLAAAQQAKYERLLGQLQLQQGDTVLEIGCGWGGFASVAQDRGLRVTGLTLSSEQLAWARERCDPSLVELRLQDYRDCDGQYDGIASIEMFEAVGEQWWPAYFEAVARKLKRGGRACIQTIVIDDKLFERYRVSSDFIQQTIFPGGMLPSDQQFRLHAQRAGLEIIDTCNFGLDYARTLRVWRERFHKVLPQLDKLGFDQRFIRTWDFYLCYCEAAFRNGNTDVLQYTLRHAGSGG